MERTFVLVLDRGDEALTAIAQFAAEAGLKAASLTAIGAFARATVGWFDLKRRSYGRSPSTSSARRSA